MMLLEKRQLKERCFKCQGKLIFKSVRRNSNNLPIFSIRCVYCGLSTESLGPLTAVWEWFDLWILYNTKIGKYK